MLQRNNIHICATQVFMCCYLQLKCNSDCPLNYDVAIFASNYVNCVMLVYVYQITVLATSDNRGSHSLILNILESLRRTRNVLV